MNFICVYRFKQFTLTVEADHLDKLKNGFLIDNRNRLTESLECARYWIPPSQIDHIEIGGS
jgi:hypothetical protein